MEQLLKSGQISKEYSDFNFWVFDYYCERNYRDGPGCLAIDEYDYNESGFNAVFFPEVYKGNWLKLLGIDSRHNIPLFFGLIGLQCVAATMVEESRIRDKFLEISGVPDVIQLNSFFSEDVSGEPVQDVIWRKLKAVLEVRGILIELRRKQRKGPYRYIRYPKSQVVLNRDDLKEYKPFFESLHEKVNGNPMSFSDFEKELYKMKQSFVRVNNRNLVRTEIKEKIRLRQIFNHYNSESWISDELKKRIYERNTQSYTLILDNDNVFVLDARNKECSPLTVLERSNNKYCFFQKHEVFSDEFILVKHLEYNREYIILYRNLYMFRDWSSGMEIPYDESLPIGFRYVSYKESESIEPRDFATYFDVKHKPIQLGGLRIGRKNVFLENVGPIIADEGYSVYLSGKRIDYNPKNCKRGEYRVRVKRDGVDFSDLRFRIIDIHFDDLKEGDIDEGVLGSRLDSLELCDAGNRMVGIKYISDDSFDDYRLNLNDWIKANTDQQQPKKNKNRFLNLIRKNRNGD